jgi:glycosyltransferase involved in cell wall biosynthesis
LVRWACVTETFVLDLADLDGHPLVLPETAPSVRLGSLCHSRAAVARGFETVAARDGRAPTDSLRSSVVRALARRVLMNRSMMHLVVSAATTWDGPYRKAVVALSRELGRRHRVLFVEFPPTVASAARQRRAPRRWQAELDVRTDRDSTVHVLTPPVVLPTNGLPAGSLHRGALALGRAIVARSVRRAIGRLGLQDVVLLNAWNPLYADSVHRATTPRRTVYFCYDELAGAPWNARHAASREPSAMKRSDAVVVTSPALYASRSATHTNVHLVPNGVDFEHCNLALSADTAVDRRIGGLQNPVIGYLGSIDHRVDLDLVAAVADRHPGVSVAMVGPIRDLHAPLPQRPNLHWLGPVRPEDIPGVLKGFRVGLIPFRQTRFTAAVYPLKVHEYLAAGLPVVRTPFAPLPDVEDLVHTAAGPDFLRAITSSLSDDVGDVASRTARARTATWASRAAALERVLEAAA